MDGKNTLKKLNGTGIILSIVSVALLIFACVYYKERIIFTDTAVYAFTMADSGNFYIATNRFICILSQLLPVTGVLLGVPLKLVLYLYSLNCILLPITASFICYRFFRNRQVALAILLFYVLTSIWVFYYPVTEFQMGLCLLMVYHAYIIWYFERPRSRAFFWAVSIILLVTITFSHPLAFYTFFAWLVWLFISTPACRKKMLLILPLIVIVSHFIKERFFKTFVGEVIYDDARKEGLNNFFAPLTSYFTAPLAKASAKVFLQEYFAVLGIVILVSIFFLLKKKWLSFFFFAAVLAGFWLLVTVSFREYNYDHYTEHLYQPIPFFIALIFTQYLDDILRSNVWRWSLLSLLFIISFSKINSNRDFFTLRLQWYQNYIGLMQEKQEQNGVITPRYLAFGHDYDYWASTCESYLLSSLPGPDSSVNLIVAEQTKQANESQLADPERKTKYFWFSRRPFRMLDELASPAKLDSLHNVFR